VRGPGRQRERHHRAQRRGRTTVVMTRRLRKLLERRLGLMRKSWRR
jgi:hypothetical protein